MEPGCQKRYDKITMRFERVLEPETAVCAMTRHSLMVDVSLSGVYSDERACGRLHDLCVEVVLMVVIFITIIIFLALTASSLRKCINTVGACIGASRLR